MKALRPGGENVGWGQRETAHTVSPTRTGGVEGRRQEQRRRGLRVLPFSRVTDRTERVCDTLQSQHAGGRGSPPSKATDTFKNVSLWINKTVVEGSSYFGKFPLLRGCQEYSTNCGCSYRFYDPPL